MRVEDETDLAFRSRLKMREPGKIPANGKPDANSVPMLQQAGESCGLAVREDEINLNMRPSERFDCVLQRSCGFEVMGKT